MEEINATFIFVEVEFRPSKQHLRSFTPPAVTHKTGKNNRHSSMRFPRVRCGSSSVRCSAIERRNSNITIASGDYFFHRGLPFCIRFLFQGDSCAPPLDLNMAG